MEQLAPIIHIGLNSPDTLMSAADFIKINNIYRSRMSGGGSDDEDPLPVPPPPIKKIVLKRRPPIRAPVLSDQEEEPTPIPAPPKGGLKSIVRRPRIIPPPPSPPSPSPPPPPLEATKEPEKPKPAKGLDAIVKRRPKITLKARPVLPPPPVEPKNPLPSSVKELLTQLGKDHTVIDRWPAAKILSELRPLLEWSDIAYADPNDVEPDDLDLLLSDKVYDYVKHTYNSTLHKTNDKKTTLKSVSSATGVGRAPTVPTKDRDTALPIPLYSLDNMFKGTGEVAKWASAHHGPYLSSCKMDGTSALYHNGRLYTRGDAVLGRDISHVLEYIRLPPFDESVRGEIVMDKRIFDAKYRNKPSRSTGTVRKANRNSVAGALGAIGQSIDPEFLSDLQFVAYEIIRNLGEGQQYPPSQQFKLLEEAGFEVAAHKVFMSIDDNTLSERYNELLNTYPYEADGLVVAVDKPYVRPSNKNPTYAQAFKEALECYSDVTKVKNIEWKVSQHGYMVPTVVYEPITVCDVTLQRATGHNAGFIVENGLGPGAIVKVTYHAKVNPQITQVLEPVAPQMPKQAWRWIDSPGGKKIHIVFDADNQEDEESRSETERSIDIQRIYRFMTTIGAKGVAEATVSKIYDAGYTTIGQFAHLQASDIAHILGDKMAEKAVASISGALNTITVPTLMAGSKVFERGLGVKIFMKIFQADPVLLTKKMTREEYQRRLKGMPGLGPKRYTQAVDGMIAYWKFIEEEFPPEIYDTIVENTQSMLEEVSGISVEEKHSDIQGKKICITGFRDDGIANFISRNGGTVQTACNGSTSMVIRKDEGYTSSKTTCAEERGLPLLTKAEFKATYMRDEE